MNNTLRALKRKTHFKQRVASIFCFENRINKYFSFILKYCLVLDSYRKYIWKSCYEEIHLKLHFIRSLFKHFLFLQYQNSLTLLLTLSPFKLRCIMRGWKIRNFIIFFILNFFWPSDVAWLQAEMGSWRLWRCWNDSCTSRTYMVTRYCSFQ